MTRVKRWLAVIMTVIVVGVSGSAPAWADPDPARNQLCISNPAYRAMHEECEFHDGPDGDQQQRGGLIGRILRGIGGLL